MTEKSETRIDGPAAGKESIGRPSEWPAGRDASRADLEQTVIRKPGEGPPDTKSTPVTRKDYEQPARPSDEKEL